MHDYLCEYGVMTQTVYDENGVASVRALRCDRLVADTLFYEAKVVLDVLSGAIRHAKSCGLL